MGKIIYALLGLILEVIKLIDNIIIMAEELKVTDEQWYIDFEDKLNEYSVRPHKYNYIVK